MGLREKINEKLLRDGQSLLARSKFDGTLCFQALYIAVTAVFLSKMSLSLIPLIDSLEQAMRYFHYAIVCFALFAWSHLLYWIFVWLKLRKEHPKVEGPLFKSSVPPVRRWAFLSMSVLWVLVMMTPHEVWALLPSRKVIFVLSHTVYTLAIPVFHIEMFRNLSLKKPWSDKKHITVATSGIILFALINIHSYTLRFGGG